MNANNLPARSIQTREWTEIRCRDCNAFFFRSEKNAIKPGAALEIKCYKCNALNYCVGNAE